MNTTNLVFLPLGVLSLAYMALLLGVRPVAAWLAAMLYLLVPVNVLQSPTTYVDSAFGSCVLALLACLCAAHVRLAAKHVPWSLALPLGSALGWVMSIKGTGPLYFAFACVWLATAGAVGWARGQAPRRLTLAGGTVLFLLLAGLLSVAVGGYWSLRNIAEGGSPIYPLQVKVAGHVLFPGDPIETLFDGKRQTPGEMRPMSKPGKVWYTWTQSGNKGYWLECLGQTDSRRGGLSFFWLLACVPAMLILLIASALSLARSLRAPVGGREGDRIAVFPFLFLFVLAAFLATPYNWWARYTLWVYGAGLPAFAVVLQWAWRRGLRHWPLRCWLTACMAMLLFEGLYAVGRVWVHPPPYWIPQSGTPYWKPAEDSLYSQALADQDAAIALYQVSTRRQSLLGSFCQPIGRRAVFLLDEATANDRAALSRYLSEHHVRFLFCGENARLPASMTSLTTDREAYPVWDLIVFSLPDEEASTAR